MNILMLYSRIPSTIGGDRIRVYHVIKGLSKSHQIDLISLSEGAPPANSTKQLKDMCNEIHIYPQHPIKFKINATKGIFLKTPLQVHYYYFKKIDKWIKKNYHKYDLIYCNHIWMAKYVEDIDIPKVIDFVDSSALFCNRALEYCNGFWKYFFNIEKNRVPGYESDLVRKFNKCFITSKIDADHIIKNLPEKERLSLKGKIREIPMGVKEDIINRSSWNEEEDWIVFCAHLKAIHNYDAAYYFARNVFPLIKKKNNKVKFIIVGADPPKHILSLKNGNGIKVTGFVKDPYYYLERAKIVVAPMRICTGVQDKVLEGMALRKTVICSPRAVEGIEGENGRHFVVAKNENEWVEELSNLLPDKKRRNEIGDNARNLINKKYSWENLGHRFLEEVNGVI